MAFLLTAALGAMSLPNPHHPANSNRQETQMKINPYLTFNGQAKEAFQFYAKVFHGEILMSMSYGETPMKNDMPPAIHDRVAHIRMTIGDQVLMASDSFNNDPINNNGMTISVVITAPAEADRIYKALAEGGKVTMEIQETFWAHRFGTLVDKYGTPWMINCEKAMEAAA
jgi:PhnB protein